MIYNVFGQSKYRKAYDIGVKTHQTVIPLRFHSLLLIDEKIPIFLYFPSFFLILNSTSIPIKMQTASPSSSK